MRLCAFADEASSSLDGQVCALLRNDILLLEMRGVNGKNIKELSLTEAKEVKKILDDSGISVWSLGSPVGKIALDGALYAHFDEFLHILELAELLGTGRIRMFSFYPVKELCAEKQRELVFKNIEKMLDATPKNILLCHENEKDIFGETAENCLALHNTFPRLRAVFDPANFVQCGEDVIRAWKKLGGFVEYLHIKDADVQGVNVPAGEGEGHLPEIVSAFLSHGGDVMTIEPHLNNFTGLSALENGGGANLGRFHYKNNNESFDAACSAFRNILKNL